MKTRRGRGDDGCVNGRVAVVDESGESTANDLINTHRCVCVCACVYNEVTVPDARAASRRRRNRAISRSEKMSRSLAKKASAGAVGQHWTLAVAVDDRFREPARNATQRAATSRKRKKKCTEISIKCHGRRPSGDSWAAAVSSVHLLFAARRS